MHKTAATAQISLLARPVFYAEKYVVKTWNGNTIFLNEGPFGVIRIVNIGHYVVKTSFATQFFVAAQVHRFRIRKIEV